MWAGQRWLPLDGPDPFRAEAAAGPLAVPEPEPERPRHVVNVADLEGDEDRLRGDVGSTWRDLGRAAGSALIGLRHIEVAPGRLSAPPHCHSAEEELFVVLSGHGALELLHPDGAAESVPVRAGSVVARPPGTGVAHAFGAGDDGLTLLACGERDPSDICFYPRSGKLSVRGVRAIFRVQRVDYWDGEG
jgi:uncharacterized cupin superfamily protein